MSERDTPVFCVTVGSLSIDCVSVVCELNILKPFWFLLEMFLNHIIGKKTSIIIFFRWLLCFMPSFVF